MTGPNDQALYSIRDINYSTTVKKKKCISFLTVTIKANEGEHFEGIFVQARRADSSKGSLTEALGQYSEAPSDTQIQNCGSGKQVLKEYYEIVGESRPLSAFFPTHADFITEMHFYS